MKKLGSWLLVLSAVGLAALCGLAWRSGTFAQSTWQAPGVLWVKGFALAWVVVAGLFFVLPRRFARGGLLAALLLIAIAAVGIGPIAAVLALVASATALGGLVLPLGSLIRQEHESPSAGSRSDLEGGLLQLVASFLVGAALISGLTSVTLHFPINTPLTWSAALLLPCLINRRYLAHWLTALGDWIRAPERSPALEYGLACLVGMALSAHLFLALLPDVGFDSLAYHLLIPDYVAHHGRWSYDFESFIWAVFPMGAEGLWTPPYLLGGEAAVRLTSYASFVALLGGLAVLVRSRASRVWTLISVALFASAPLAALEMVTLFTENTLTSFLVGAFALLMVCGTKLSHRGAAAVTILMAGAMATKLIAVFTVAPLGLWLAWILVRRHGWRRGLAFSTVCALLLAALGGVAYFYAWHATGNPVFPFFNSVFQSEHWQQENMYNSHWQGNLSWDLPWQTVVHSNRFLESSKGAFGFQYLVFLPFLISSVWPGRGRPRGALAALLLFALAVAGNFSFQQYLRYVYPVLPLLAFAFTVGAARLADGKAIRSATVVLALGVMLGNALVFPAACLWLTSAPFDAAFSNSARLRLLNRLAPTRLLIERVNASHGRQARVAFMQPAAGAGLEGAAIYYSWHNPQFQKAIHRATTVEQLAATIRQNRITHIVASPSPHHQRELIELFLEQHARAVATLDAAALYQIEPAVAHGPELLSNSDFAAADEAWVLIGEPPVEFDRAAGVARLGRGQHLAQKRPLGELGSCYVEFQARSAGAPTAAFLSLVWFDRDGELIGREHRVPHLDDTLVTRSFLFSPPARATEATVRFTTFGSEIIEVHQLSLRH